MKKIFFLCTCMLAALAMQAEAFVKVTDAGTLQDGDKVVMAYQSETAKKVSAGFSSSNKFLDATNATFSGNQVSVESPTVITLKKSGSYWKLFIGGKPVGHKSGVKDLDTNKKTETEYAISFTDGKVNIVSQTTNTYAFYYNSTSPRFALYTSSSNQQPIELYKLDESTIPDVVPTSVELSKNSLELRVGGEETLTATVKPVEAEDKTIAWGTTDASVATVADGVVTAVAEGTAKIWVKATAGENVSDTCVVTVLPAAAVGDATYNAVQSADYLPVGAKVFFGTSKDGENYVMGQYVSGNNIKGTAATYGESRHSVTAPLQVAYTVARDGDKYMFVDHDGKYLRTMSSSKLGSGENDSYAKWTLGTIDQDDATVVVTASNGKGIYNNFQGSNDLFNIYDGVGDGTNLAKIILYSDKAPEWVERVKDPWIHPASTYIDWGKQEPDEYTNDWGDTRYVELTMNDLPADIEVELTEDGNGTFSCYGGTIKKTKTSEKFSVYWEATQVGVYEGKITLTCPGLETIEIILHAEAVAKGQGGGETGEEPELTVSANHIYLNPTTGAETAGSDHYMSAEYTFTFSAKNLSKSLRVKWWRDTYYGTWFPWASEKMEMWMAYEPLNYIYEPLALNDRIDLGTDDITDFEIYIAISGIQNAGTYYSELQFTSLKEGSSSEYAINKIIPITVVVSEQPIPDPNPEIPEGIEDVKDGVSARKVLRDGQLLIIRNGETFNANGVKVD